MSQPQLRALHRYFPRRFWVNFCLEHFFATSVLSVELFVVSCPCADVCVSTPCTFSPSTAKVCVGSFSVFSASGVVKFCALLVLLFWALSWFSGAPLLCLLQIVLQWRSILCLLAGWWKLVVRKNSRRICRLIGATPKTEIESLLRICSCRAEGADSMGLFLGEADNMRKMPAAILRLSRRTPCGYHS